MCSSTVRLVLTYVDGAAWGNDTTTRQDHHFQEHIKDQREWHAISYAAQSQWLRHQTIKDNILFGYPFVEERVNAVVECCALKPDLESLEDGNATEIGARGVGLLGGQDMRYVLLDGPLSAVVSCPVILPD